MLQIEKKLVSKPLHDQRLMFKGLKQLLHVDAQGSDIMVWAMCESNEFKGREVRLWLFPTDGACEIVPTGDFMINELIHWQTVIMRHFISRRGEGLTGAQKHTVFHIFIERKDLDLLPPRRSYLDVAIRGV